MFVKNLIRECEEANLTTKADGFSDVFTTVLFGVISVSQFLVDTTWETILNKPKKDNNNFTIYKVTNLLLPGYWR